MHQALFAPLSACRLRPGFHVGLSTILSALQRVLVVMILGLRHGLDSMAFAFVPTVRSWCSLFLFCS